MTLEFPALHLDLTKRGYAERNARKFEPARLARANEIRSRIAPLAASILDRALPRLHGREKEILRASAGFLGETDAAWWLDRADLVEEEGREAPAAQRLLIIRVTDAYYRGEATFAELDRITDTVIEAAKH